MTRIFVALSAALVFTAAIAATPDSSPDGAQDASAASQPSPRNPSGPVTISSGGTYSGNWISTSSTPAVRITTTQPVVIQDSIIANLSGGPLVVTDWPLAADVTVRTTRALGGSGRFVEAEGFKSIRIMNCTIDKTSGIKLVQGVEGSSVMITRNRHRNIQRGSLNHGNFVQLAEVQNATIEVSWNEIINHFGRSEAEDVVSVYKSAHARIHDNYLQGGYPVVNTKRSSANGITVEVGDGIGPASFDNEIWNNTVVDNVGGIGLVGGHDNYAHHNRIVQDGRLPQRGHPRLQAANLGLAVWNLGGFAGFANNRAHHNTVGFVNASGHRSDMWFPDAPTDYPLNTRMRGKITLTNEQATWKAWLVKVAANGIRVGA